jgi:hypothetical protein
LKLRERRCDLALLRLTRYLRPHLLKDIEPLLLQLVLQCIDLSQEIWICGPGGEQGIVKLLAQWH